MDSMKRLEGKRQFSAVAQTVGFGIESQKCFIFQGELTDSLSAAALFSSVSDRSN
jgi:hypothetical protein